MQPNPNPRKDFKGGKGRKVPSGGIRQEQSILSVGNFPISAKIREIVRANPDRYAIITEYDDLTGRVIIKIADFGAKPTVQVCAPEMLGLNVNGQLVRKFIIDKETFIGVPKVEKFIMTAKSFYESQEAKEEAPAQEAKVNVQEVILHRLQRKVKMDGEVITLRDLFPFAILQVLYGLNGMATMAELAVRIGSTRNLATQPDHFAYIDFLTLSDKKYKESVTGFRTRQAQIRPEGFPAGQAYPAAPAQVEDEEAGDFKEEEEVDEGEKAAAF